MAHRVAHHQRHRLHYARLTRGNSVIIAVLTVISTALTAYLLTVITKNMTSESPVSRVSTRDSLGFPQPLESASQQAPKHPNHRMNYKRSLRSNQSIILPKEWQPIVEASEEIVTRVKPDDYITQSLHKFKDRLAHMSQPELLKLLRVLQAKVGKAPATSIIKKRHASRLTASDTQKISTHVEPTIMRSDKMSRLMSYLDSIESISPTLDAKKLKRMSTMDEGGSIIRVVKPEIMAAMLSTSNPARVVRETASWQDQQQNKFLVPNGEAGWPQQDVVVEDWPTVQPVQPAAQPKRRKKKKKVPITTTTTTTTTTPAPVFVETTTFTPPPSPAPPSAAPFEEVWIEEEEDIYRPPRRKTKKYKKKTSAAPETTTTSTTTTTTTTTTTPAPTTAAPVVEPVAEEWPNDVWPAQSSTKAPTLWPANKQEEQWPEEEWLDAFKNDIQNRLHIVYV